MTTIERHFVRTRSGRRHVAEAGSGPAVLLLHQTPRSWDEYRDLLPLLGRHVRAIALDTPGFGDSDPLPDGPPSIEAWAAAALDLLDARGIDQAVVVGHHTGAVIALEMAARAPERLPALVLSACPMVDPPRRAHHAGRRVVDEVERGPHGQHLGALWQARASFYPPDRPDLLERFVVDALKAGDLAVEGHRVVNRYHMETRLPRVTCPTLVIDPLADPHAHPSAARIAAAIPGAQLVPIEGGMVPLPDQHPTAFAAAILDFLAAQRWTGDALPPSAGDALRSRHGQR